MGKVRIADDVIVHEEAAEAFLLHVASGRYFGLNPTGLVVWQALTSGSDPVAALQEHWPDVDQKVLRADVDHLFESLAEAGLIESDDQASSGATKPAAHRGSGGARPGGGEESGNSDKRARR